MRGLVGLVLGLAHPAGHVLVVSRVAEHLGQQAGTRHEVLCGLGEEVVESRVDRAESQTHGELLVRRRRTAIMLGGAIPKDASEDPVKRTSDASADAR